MCSYGNQLWLALTKLRATRALDLFLKSPENFSGTKSQLSNCNLFVFKKLIV